MVHQGTIIYPCPTPIYADRMSVIVHLRIPSDSFELGRIMAMDIDTTVQLTSMVPLGEKAIPLITVFDHETTAFEESVGNHPSVDQLKQMSYHNGETVYALDWNVGRDVFFSGIQEFHAHLLSATGTRETWEFELRFPDHDALSAFQEYCSDAHITLEVGRIYNPTRPGTGAWYGLTPEQKETLMQAVEGGYYSIPRQMSTDDLAEEFGVSDQAVTERLRRAIVTLVDNTLIAQSDEAFETVD